VLTKEQQPVLQQIPHGTRTAGTITLITAANRELQFNAKKGS